MRLMAESVSLAGRPTVGFGLGDACPVCPAALPSGSSAAALLGGDVSALPAVVGSTIARAVLVGSGLIVAGERMHVVRNAVAGALAIEAFVLGWAAWKLKTSRKAVTP
jgi:hypothetical protein